MNWLKRLVARTSRPPCWPPGVPELTVEELHQSRKRGLQMRMRHPAFAMLADDIAQMFDEAGAVNYVEYTVCSEKHGPMRVCIQRLEGETPAMQNERLRKRIAELEANASADLPAVADTVKPVVRHDPLWICATCGHEWDDGMRPHCIACGTPYRKPNNVLCSNSNIDKSKPTD